MSNLKIKDLQEKKNETVDIFLLVSSLVEAETSTHKKYIEFILNDGVDKILGKLWNTSINEVAKGITIGTIIKVKAKVEDWNGLYLNIQLYRPIEERDNVDEDQFIKTAPIDGQTMYNFILSVVTKIKNKNIKTLTSTVLTDNKEKLLYYPGAKSVHHDIKAGLLYHTYMMLNAGMKLAEVYNLNKDIFFAGIILHDIGKVRELEANKNGIASDFTSEGKLLGHLIEGIKIITLTSAKLGIPDEISEIFEHIIASHHGEIEKGALKKPMFFEAQTIYNLDMIDSRAYMYEEVNRNLEPNTFTEKPNFFLNNVLVYNHKVD